METLYIIIVNTLMGTGMILIGFKIYKPKFRSEEVKEKFYESYTLLFQLGGIGMLIWAAYNFLM